MHPPKEVAMRRLFVPVAAVLILAALLPFSLCCTSCVGDLEGLRYTYRSDAEQTYALQAGGTASVKNVDGYVRVLPWDKNEVGFKGVLRVSAASKEEARRLANDIKVIVSHDEKSFSLEVKKTRSARWIHWGVSRRWVLDIDLNVPRQCNLDLSTVDGSVEVSGVEGALRVSSVDGAVDVSDVRGDIHCRTVDGSCELLNVEGKVDAASTDGSIRVEGKLHGLGTRTVDGSVHVVALEGSTNPQGWRLSTVDGSVAVLLPKSLSFDLEASSVDGHISVSEAAQFVSVSHRKVVAKLGQGGPPLSISTTEGSISVEFEE
jgi:hypothetical protein